jgi:hypothetical protein
MDDTPVISPRRRAGKLSVHRKALRLPALDATGNISHLDKSAVPQKLHGHPAPVTTPAIDQVAVIFIPGPETIFKICPGKVDILGSFKMSAGKFVGGTNIDDETGLRFREKAETGSGRELSALLNRFHQRPVR